MPHLLVLGPANTLVQEKTQDGIAAALNDNGMYSYPSPSFMLASFFF